MLTLFSQLPTNTKFRFEKPDAGPVYIKTNEAGAHRDGAYQRVSPSVLVFAVPNKIITVSFLLNNAEEHIATKMDSGHWYLQSFSGDGKHNQVFNTLEDVIHHLES